MRATAVHDQQAIEAILLYAERANVAIAAAGICREAAVGPAGVRVGVIDSVPSQAKRRWYYSLGAHIVDLSVDDHV